MPIFRALGFGIFIITLRLLLPSVLTEGEQTMIAFLQGSHLSADTASSLVAGAASVTAGTTPSSSLPQLVLPRTPNITYP